MLPPLAQARPDFCLHCDTDADTGGKIIALDAGPEVIA
jgi:hypothetical protein